MGNIIWLASYPKSGNTWLRIFLANYIANSEQPIPINNLGFGWIASLRDEFDEEVGIASAHLTPAEIDFYRPAYHERLSAQLEKPTFIKVHDAYTHNCVGQPLFPATATAGVIYLVRNPLDVTVSYAHHCAWSIKRTIREMNREQSTLARNEAQLTGQLHQRLLTWSGHVRSWTEQTALPTHVVRYEDMLQTPIETFTKIINFAQLPFATECLQRALAFSRFDKLQEQEKAHGFLEKEPVSASFFRRGEINTWRTELTTAEVKLIISHHKTMMERFGYGEGHDARHLSLIQPTST